MLVILIVFIVLVLKYFCIYFKFNNIWKIYKCLVFEVSRYNGCKNNFSVIFIDMVCIVILYCIYYKIFY